MNASGRVPAVSVVMPVYNEAPFVEAAIQSILRQTMSDLELVVVDNGSTDDSPEILRRIIDRRVRVLRNPRNLGSAAASNLAVRESRAALIARMDADDIALPHRLEKQLAAFTADPELALLGGQARPFESHGSVLQRIAPRAVTRAGIAWQSLFSSPFIHSTVMVTRKSFDAAGGYDERMLRSSDFALFSRIRTTHRAANLPEVIVRFRRAPRATLPDETYQRLVRDVIAANVRHALEPERADHRLRTMIDEWPDFCLMLRGAPISGFELARLPDFLFAFQDRFRDLYDDPSAAREIARDVNFMLSSHAWQAVHDRRPSAARLARVSLAHAPLFTCEFVMRELADAAFRRLRSAW